MSKSIFVYFRKFREKITENYERIISFVLNLFYFLRKINDHDNFAWFVFLREKIIKFFFEKYVSKIQKNRTKLGQNHKIQLYLRGFKMQNFLKERALELSVLDLYLKPKSPKRT